MSSIRWKNLPPFRSDAHGYYLCRLCKAPCPENERSWCSDACLKKYLVMSSGSYVRAKLLERDGGVCALCGVNAEQMDAALRALQEDLLHPLLMTIHPLIVATLRADGWTNVKTKNSGMYPDAIKFTSCWEADHVNPVAGGGGQCEEDNFRTLCYVCHKQISARQATARAKKAKKTSADLL